MADGDKQLPIANVGRIMKQILPPSAKISKEAKERMQECASEFICFVTGEASDRCHKENRKTVNGDDICWALSALGFDNYSEAMLKYVHKLREFQMLRAIHGSNKACSCNEKGDETSDFGDLELPIRASSDTLIDFKILERGDQISSSKSST